MFNVCVMQGLSFAFPIPSQYTDCCHEGEGIVPIFHPILLFLPKCSFSLLNYCISVSAQLPLEFPDGTTPVTCRVSIYDSSLAKKVGVGTLLDKAVAPPLPHGSLYMEEVHVKVGLLLDIPVLVIQGTTYKSFLAGGFSTLYFISTVSL